jgi:starvation-inducible DNA-binding protein
MAARNVTRVSFTVPGVNESDAGTVTALLQQRLNALTDLALTLKHIHWNVVGPHFVAIHTMIDPQVDAVRLMADETAERIATLGGAPVGTPGALVAHRSWDDYSIGRDEAIAHMGALDIVYTGIIAAHREAIAATEDADPVSQDMLISQARQLEKLQWFVRAHLESVDGTLTTKKARTESAAAGRSRR